RAHGDLVALADRLAAVDRWVLVWPAGEVPIGDAAIVIGRSKDCDISLADGNVSRRHAEFGRDGEGFAIRDLDSTNGTLVNGRRIRREPVGEGDEITVGTSTLRIERRPG
ncbi:MAG: FHA domain-containing protein, partial [Actinomycetota bacterium]